MYACIPEIGGGFFEGVCTLTTNHFLRPTPTPQHERTGALAMGLRPEWITPATVDGDLA